MSNFSDIIMRWPSAEEFARDMGIPGGVARAWKNRNSIPSAYWLDTIQAAKSRGIKDVTLDGLARAAKRDAASSGAKTETPPPA